MYRQISTLALATIIAASALAQRGHVAPADAKANTIKTATQIKWHPSLDAAMAQARKEDKLVFYVHMLGKIDADT